MNLISQIEKDAVDGTGNLSELLRKCMLLSYKLGNDDFKQWVANELKGYPHGAALPDYRVVAVESLGTFSGAFYSMMKNVPIPVGVLPKELAERLATYRFIEGVAALEHLVQGDSKSQLCVRWPADIIALHQGDFYEGYNLVEAYRMIGRSSVVAIVDTIRNRALEFAIHLDEQFQGKTFDKSEGTLESGMVQQVFNNYILGDGNRVAFGCGDIDQSEITKNEKGNWCQVESFLRNLKITDEDIASLRTALRNEPPRSGTCLGSEVTHWIGMVIGKIGEGLYDLSIGTASGVLSAVICRYCGFAC